jgi:hypothetical protein
MTTTTEAIVYIKIDKTINFIFICLLDIFMKNIAYSIVFNLD